MRYDIDVSDKNRITVDDWNEQIDLKLFDKPMEQGPWQFVNGIVLSKSHALALAIDVLNRTGNSAALAKKYRREI